MEQAALNNSLDNFKIMTDAQKKELQDKIDDYSLEIVQLKQLNDEKVAKIESIIKEKESKIVEQDGIVQ